MSLDTTPSPARCNHCLKVFASKNKATEHAKIAGHLPAQIVRICTDCGKTFDRNAEQHEHANLTGHMRSLATEPAAMSSTPSSSGTPVGAFVCTDCSVSFANANVLAEVCS